MWCCKPKGTVKIMSGDTWYKGTIDKKPVKVTVIQYADKGRRVEIIRNTRIMGRKTFAGFWVDTTDLIIESNNPL